MKERNFDNLMSGIKYRHRCIIFQSLAICLVSLKLLDGYYKTKLNGYLYLDYSFCISIPKIFIFVSISR
jgi:hypothetical protein